MLMVMPTLELMDRFVKRRLNRLIEETDAVAAVVKGNTKRDASNSLGLKVFAGGSLIMAGANSPNSLRSDAVRYTICDEVDGFEWEVGQEGDPLSLIENRMRTYARRKLFMVSTPTIKGYSRIEQEYQRSDMRRYHVPCPHCGEPQHLKWKNLKWKTALPSARAVPGVTVTAYWPTTATRKPPSAVGVGVSVVFPGFIRDAAHFAGEDLIDPHLGLDHRQYERLFDEKPCPIGRLESYPKFSHPQRQSPGQPQGPVMHRELPVVAIPFSSRE